MALSHSDASCCSHGDSANQSAFEEDGCFEPDMGCEFRLSSAGEKKTAMAWMYTCQTLQDRNSEESFFYLEPSLPEVCRMAVEQPRSDTLLAGHCNPTCI